MLKVNSNLLAAKKANVDFARLVGPFPSSKKPAADRPGLYIRISTKTGEACWSYWNGKAFGLWADSKKRAMARREKLSKSPARWFGYTTTPKGKKS